MNISRFRTHVTCLRVWFLISESCRSALHSMLAGSKWIGDTRHVTIAHRIVVPPGIYSCPVSPNVLQYYSSTKLHRRIPSSFLFRFWRCPTCCGRWSRDAAVQCFAKREYFPGPMGVFPETRVRPRHKYESRATHTTIRRGALCFRTILKPQCPL